MREFAEVIVSFFAELDFINRDKLSDGGNIFFGDELYQNQDTLSFSISSINEIVLQNGDFEQRREITLSAIWYGNLNYLDTYEKALKIYRHLLNKKWSRNIHERIFFIEVSVPEYSDKVEDRYVFSFDFTVGWEGDF